MLVTGNRATSPFVFSGPTHPVTLSLRCNPAKNLKLVLQQRKNALLGRRQSRERVDPTAIRTRRSLCWWHIRNWSGESRHIRRPLRLYPQLSFFILCISSSLASCQGSLEAFARYTGANAHIIIIGRNEAAANQIIEGLPKTEGSKYEFLQCDASKLANVKAASEKLKGEYGLKKVSQCAQCILESLFKTKC